MTSHDRLSVALIALFTHGGPLTAGGQDLSPIPLVARQKAVQLLNNSPLLRPTMSVVGEAAFVRDSKEVLRSIPGGDTIAAGLATARDATAELENVLAGSSVQATVVSVPSGLLVGYRRLVDDHAPILNTTSDATLAIEPALYLFRCTNPRTRQVEERRIACATNCKVEFRFTTP